MRIDNFTYSELSMQTSPKNTDSLQEAWLRALDSVGSNHADVRLKPPNGDADQSKKQQFPPTNLLVQIAKDSNDPDVNIDALNSANLNIAISGIVVPLGQRQSDSCKGFAYSELPPTALPSINTGSQSALDALDGQEKNPYAPVILGTSLLDDQNNGVFASLRIVSPAPSFERFGHEVARQSFPPAKAVTYKRSDNHLSEALPIESPHLDQITFESFATLLSKKPSMTQSGHEKQVDDLQVAAKSRSFSHAYTRSELEYSPISHYVFGQAKESEQLDLESDKISDLKNHVLSAKGLVQQGKSPLNEILASIPSPISSNAGQVKAPFSAGPLSLHTDAIRTEMVSVASRPALKQAEVTSKVQQPARLGILIANQAAHSGVKEVARLSELTSSEACHASSAPRPQSETKPWERMRLHVYTQDGKAAVWIRDSRVDEGRVSVLLNSIQLQLQQTGHQMEALTVNGRLVWQPKKSTNRCDEMTISSNAYQDATHEELGDSVSATRNTQFNSRNS